MIDRRTPAFLVAFFLASALLANDPPPPQPHPAATSAEPHAAAAPAPSPEAHQASAQPEAQHASASSETHGGGHHGPTVKLFGFAGPALSPLGQFLVKLLNFAVFAGALVFGIKGILAHAFKARAKELEEKLSQAERDKAEGEAQIRALQAKMDGLQVELDGILATAATEAEAEKARILEVARAEAEAILAQARFDIESQYRQAEQELRALVADLAVEGARGRLEARLRGDEALSAMNRAIAQVGGVE